MAAKKRDHSEVSRAHSKPIRFFKVILEDTIESGKLRVPKHFFRNHEKDLCSLNVVILKVPNTDDEWKVSLRKYRNGELWFEKGWKEFASFYSIQLGDFVVFKWKLEMSLFQVLIFSKTLSEKQYPSMCTPVIKVELSDDEDDVPVKKMKRSTGEASSSKHGKAQTEHCECMVILHDMHGLPRPGSEFASEYPFFQANITNSTLIYKTLNVPGSFVRDNMNIEWSHQIVTLETDGGSWPANLAIYSKQNYRGKLSGGLQVFLEENNVKEGDLCTFELVKRKNMVFRVSIHRC